MILARGAVPQGPHPPKPPELQPDASERLLKMSSIAEVLVRAYEPRPRNCAVGVIKGIPVNLDQADILALLFQRAPVSFLTPMSSPIAKSILTLLDFLSPVLAKWH
ncbi:hypothetical protein MRX96_044712 [Rhipicephalus microplus]